MDAIDPDTIAAAHIENAGKAFFGEHWVKPLAALLNVNDRTMQRIASAAKARSGYPAARGLIEEVQRRLTQRALEFLMVAELMDRARPEMALPPATCVTIPLDRLREVERPPSASATGGTPAPSQSARRSA